MAGQWARRLEGWARDWRGDRDWRARVELAVVVREQAERMLADAVDQARADGASWADVAAVLGVSRQTAWERFGPLTEDAPPAERGGS